MSSQPPNTNSSVQPGPAPTIGTNVGNFRSGMQNTAPVNGDDIQAQPVGPNTAVNGQATPNTGVSIGQDIFGSQSTTDNSSAQSFINKLANSPGMDGQGATTNRDPQNGPGLFTLPPMSGPVDIGLNISTPCGMSVQERVATLSCYEYHYFDLVCNGQVFPYFFPGYWIGHDLGVIAGHDYVCQSGPGNIDTTKPVQVIVLNNNSDIGNNGVPAADATANEPTSLADTVAKYALIGYDIPSDAEAVFIGPGGVQTFPRCATGCLSTGSSYTVPNLIQGNMNPLLGTVQITDQIDGPIIPLENSDGSITWTQQTNPPDGPDIMQGPTNNSNSDLTAQVTDGNGNVIGGNIPPGSSLQAINDGGQTLIGLRGGVSSDQGLATGEVNFTPLTGSVSVTDQLGGIPEEPQTVLIPSIQNPLIGVVQTTAPLQGQASVGDPLEGIVEYLPSPTPTTQPTLPAEISYEVAPSPSYPNPYNQPTPTAPKPQQPTLTQSTPTGSMPSPGSGGGGQQVSVTQLIIVQDDSSQTYITTG